MCGIVGLASSSPLADRRPLAPMRDVLWHRGPDDQGEWWSADGRVGFGHRRLAIIDLSAGGHQPMSDASGALTITFNGEIYNYRETKAELEGRGHSFRTASDTEVILEAYRAWGEECLSHLNGMFAFALHDRARGVVLLARDRAGEKPLFYRHAGGVLAFASELKALMADPDFPRRLDPVALDHYLAYGYVPGEMCLLKGVRKLPPAHALSYELDRDRLRLQSYWRLPQPATARDTEESLLEELEALLLDSVRLRLIADVPVGILLSGGIDSGLVTAMAARVSSGSVKTFTVSFPGHLEHDEGPQARLVARHLGTDHTEIVAEPAAVDLLPALARQYDEPIADSSMVPTALVSRAIRAQTKVALGGDGGDELFAGYPHYDWVAWQERARRVVPGPLRRVLGTVASALIPPGVPGRNHLVGFAGDVADSIAHVNLYFDARLRRRLVVGPPPDGACLPPESRRRAFCDPGLTPLQQATRADFQTTMVDGYLVKVDRASMLASLEVRAPWLDHRLVELAFSRVPDHLRAEGRLRKVLPRRLAERLLPRELDLDRKRGFMMPLATWFRDGWGAWMGQVLREADPSLFDRRVIEALFAGQARGMRNAGRIFSLTIFELWRREYRVVL